MTKTEYTAAIETDLKAANALCAELRTLRNFKKIAQAITDADKMVSFETLDKTITSKEAELLSAPFENVDFRRNGVSFLTGQHTGVIQP